MSTVRGIMSMPVWLVWLTVVAVNTPGLRFWVVRVPLACFAYLPVSNVKGLPLMVAWERVTGMWLLISGAYEKTQDCVLGFRLRGRSHRRRPSRPMTSWYRSGLLRCR